MQNSDSNELIAFYNVENLFLPDKTPVHKQDPTVSGLRNWDSRKYQSKLAKIASVFEFMKQEHGVIPMLIGLCEIHGQQPLNELVRLKPFDSRYGVVHFDSMDERGMDVALLYDKDKLEIIHSEPISFFFGIDEGTAAYYDTTRDILYCKARYESKIIHLFVFHLPSKREKDINKPRRDFILKEIRERIIKLTQAKEAVVVCGDFNENPDAESLNKLLYDDNFSKILTNPYGELYNNGVFSTFHMKDGLVFDQIIFSKEFIQPGFPLKFINAKVFNSSKLLSSDKKFIGRPFRTYAGTRYLGGYSDHFPVFIELLQNKNK
ncbi:endonuclease/exonuclease/phosphatase family protein [Chryseobacterium sp.]|uniref:endonuclease/exonuclease/phosphatase family protein n=1 Tax=Chryseobacterium sp. TaxID=1871047 RepID=UPI0011C7FB3C|nr:endonuclease/exonuclease/phosphatase family protein [Chryseobacterium sp.]TXF77385.1 endonuclease [Chryseobacterium sp.]